MRPNHREVFRARARHRRCSTREQAGGKSAAKGGHMIDNGDAAKWARARAVAAEEEALQEQYADHKREQALASRFRTSGATEVMQMFEAGVNEKGQPLSQFEFEAL